MLRLALLLAIIAGSLTPVSAQDMSALAPADAYFGKFKMSILGIANTIRDAGVRVDAGSDPQNMIDGPLAFATDAIHAWQTKYPNDPWIAKDLVALEAVYLRFPGEEAYRLAVRTSLWVTHDYPNTSYAVAARQLIGPRGSTSGNVPGVTPWERFASSRVPLR